MERKRVLRQIDIDTDMFMTSFENAANLLLEQKNKLEKDGWTNIHLKMEHCYEHSELVVMGLRLENDVEYDQRISAEQKKLLYAQKKVERERKKYEELKSKYEQ